METSNSALALSQDALVTESQTTLYASSQPTGKTLSEPYQPRHQARLLLTRLIQFVVSLIALTLYAVTFASFNSAPILFALTCHAFSLFLTVLFLTIPHRFVDVRIEVLSSVVMVCWCMAEWVYALRLVSCSLDPMDHVLVTSNSTTSASTQHWQTLEKRDDGTQERLNVCYIYSVGLIFAWIELLSWCVVVGFSLERWRNWLWFQHLRTFGSQAGLVGKNV